MYKTISYILASSFGVGYFPFASGTAGSFVTLPLAFGVLYYFGFWGILICSIIIFFLGVVASKEVLKYTKHDPSLIVIDEVVGQLLTFIFLAYLLEGKSLYDTWVLYIIGFFLFRLFDIWKPQPAKWADSSVLNAWGVMLDDVFAGLYAGVVLYAINYFAKIV